MPWTAQRCFDSLVIFFSQIKNQMNSQMLIVGSTSARRKGKQIQSIIHLLHDVPVYPPKMYFPTRIIVTVGPLLSHNEWKVVLAQPSTDARQQRFQ